MNFDPSSGHILIWQPPLPPETTMLVPTDPTAEQVDLRAPAPPGDSPCWLTHQYFEGEQAAASPAHSQTDTTQHARVEERDHPVEAHPTVKMLANLIAANAMLEFVRNAGRHEHQASDLPKKKKEEEE
jgi:hypothetical protein